MFRYEPVPRTVGDRSGDSGERASPQQLEAALQANPADRATRKALLDYYFLNSVVPASVAIPARRRHILWLIENAPSDELAGTPAAIIDASGHRSADAQGFKLAAEAWRRSRPDLCDGEPGSDHAEQERLPAGIRPGFGPVGGRTAGYDKLGTSTNPYVLAVTGYQLSFQGAILRGSGNLGFDAGPLAESVLQRALSLAPNDPDVASFMQQHREIQRTIQAGRRR